MEQLVVAPGGVRAVLYRRQVGEVDGGRLDLDLDLHVLAQTPATALLGIEADGEAPTPTLDHGAHVTPYCEPNGMNFSPAEFPAAHVNLSPRRVAPRVAAGAAGSRSSRRRGGAAAQPSSPRASLPS